MNIPFCYHQQIEMFTDIKRGHIHLLNLTENELSHNKLKKLIHQISELNNIDPTLSIGSTMEMVRLIELVHQ
ncbi:hypothetical protein [Cytobacillus firmus]|uniref:hypothetical protein n=1 Tax=Cytobacillus firmus TaxID=1399 RepID=UPI001A7E43A9|nr:hypothetical protein [Cytobacillus firmus]MBG9590200.1 hypothetical protein [Cytobacillus firmus]